MCCAVRASPTAALRGGAAPCLRSCARRRRGQMGRAGRAMVILRVDPPSWKPQVSNGRRTYQGIGLHVWRCARTCRTCTALHCCFTRAARVRACTSAHRDPLASTRSVTCTGHTAPHSSQGPSRLTQKRCPLLPPACRVRAGRLARSHQHSSHPFPRSTALRQPAAAGLSAL